MRVAAAWRRADEAAGGLALDLGLYGLSAAFAAITAVTSTLDPHRGWGAIAVWGYAAATLITFALLVSGRATAGVRALVTIAAWVGTALIPLVVLAAQDRAQEEVIVVERAGERLVETGTPYLDRAAIAALPEGERLLGYVPYQPGMALFGLPRALGDEWWADARVWFAVATAAALAGAIAALRRHGTPAGQLVRAGQAATVLPLCALTLATGGDDLPVLALLLLALALAAVGRPGSAGLAAGAAGALKLFAWPVALVLAFAVGRKMRYAAGALGLPLLALVPAAVADPAAAVENVLTYPLGRGLVTSPAQSPFPGHLIATGVPGGRAIALALLLAAGVAIAVGLLRRPPRTAAAAALWSGYGLTAAILLLPATRFGYLLYPVALLVWAPALRAAEPTPLAVSLPASGRGRTLRA